MLGPMSSWEDKEGAREADMCHTQREGGGGGGETRHLSPHRGPAFGGSGAGAAMEEGARPAAWESGEKESKAFSSQRRGQAANQTVRTEPG